MNEWTSYLRIVVPVLIAESSVARIEDNFTSCVIQTCLISTDLSSFGVRPVLHYPKKRSKHHDLYPFMGLSGTKRRPHPCNSWTKWHPLETEAVSRDIMCYMEQPPPYWSRANGAKFNISVLCLKKQWKNINSTKFQTFILNWNRSRNRLMITWFPPCKWHGHNPTGLCRSSELTAESTHWFDPKLRICSNMTNMDHTM